MSEPGEITALDDRTIREIAAGEVVERPASVVKELVENALDADADRVAVAVSAGGIDRIRVRDTGHGIAPGQLPRAVGEHTTSKLDDGLQSVASLGFRGEALHSIGAVSRLTIRSRPDTADVGAAITVAHGERGEATRVGCPTGTTVEVTELFAETPARRKFLAEATTEFDHVNRVVSAYALANPDVAVSLEHDGREVFASPGDGSVRSAALAVYGGDVARSLIDVGDTTLLDGDSPDDAANDDTPDHPSDDAPDQFSNDASDADHADEPAVRVGGVVSDPETTRASRAYVTTFVNGRWVRDGDLRAAVIDAYGGQLAADRYPFAVVHLSVPPAAVDANVHPRKTEVRFDDTLGVHETIRETVRSGLLSAGLLRGSAPRGASAPDETALDQHVVGGAGTDHERVARDRREQTTDDSRSNERAALEGDTAASGVGAASGAETADDPSASGDTADDPSDRPSTSDDTVSEPGGTDDSTAVDSVLDAWGDVTDDASSEAGVGTDDDTPAGDGALAGDSTASSSEPDTPVDADASDPHHVSGRGGDTEPSPRNWQTTDPDTATVPTQTTLAGEDATGPETEQLPELRVLGQYDDTYLVCETADGLVLVDQHAADERVNYERLTEAVGDDAQALVEPVTLELTAREAALFDRLQDAMTAIGFETTRRDDRTVAVTAVPAVFDATLDPELLRDALVAAGEGMAADDPVAEAADELLADLACYPSITGHTSLTEGTATELLAALDACENPYACPHGRPVLVQFDADEIDDRFERDYPGHGRRDR